MEFPILSSPTRRAFLKACAGCAGACGVPSLCAASSATEDAKSKIRVIFAQAPADRPGWPYVNFDYDKTKREILAQLKPAESFASFETATATSAEESKKVLATGNADGYLLFLLGIPTFGAGREIAFSGRPTVIVDHLYGGTGEFLGVYGPARKKGMPVAGVASSRFSDVIQGVRALHTLRRMKGATLVTVTGRDVSSMSTQIREAYGTEVARIGGDELNALYDKASASEAAEWAHTWTKNAGKIVEPTSDDILQGGRMYVAMRSLMSAQRSRALTVDCLNLYYSGKLRAYPCLGFFQLNNDNQVGACEGDLTSTSTMLLMSYLTGQPGYISDPVIDTARNLIIYAHCVAPSKVWGPDKPSNEYHIRSHSEDRKGAAVRSLMPLGVMTTTLEFLPGRREVLMHQAKAVENVDDDKACRTKLAAEPRDAFKLAEDWEGGWHRVTYYGDHRAAVDMLAGLLQFRVKMEG